MKEPFYLTEVVEDGFSLFSLGGQDDHLPDLYDKFSNFKLSEAQAFKKSPLPIVSLEEYESEPPDIRVAVNLGTVLDGTLHFSEAVRIDGKVSGTIKSSCLLVLGELSEVAARVSAEQVIVYGYFKGSIKAQSTVTVRAGACLIGDVRCPKLVVEQGGVFEGKSFLGAALEVY